MMIANIKRFLMTMALIMMSVSAFAETPFESYANDNEVSRKYISSRLLKSMDLPIIQSGDVAFEATDLKVVDVIETLNPERWKKINQEMVAFAKNAKLEVLWSDKNNMLRNETTLYGKYDEKKQCYTTLMVIYLIQGWKFKCVYVEGQLNIMNELPDYGYYFNDLPASFMSGVVVENIR